MQQPCSRCGYVSDRPARFCRQCGSQLTVETEASSATTRNYSPAAVPNNISQASLTAYAPQQRWDDQTPETSPFYRPPMAPQYQAPIAEQKRTNWWKWILISLLTFMLLCGLAVGGAIYMGGRWIKNHPSSETVDDNPAATAPAPPPDAPNPPDAPPAPATSTNLDSYKYPDAEITKSHRDRMTEMIQMTTDDDLQDVRAYYQKKFKNAMSFNDEEGKKLVFTSLGQPLITVIVQPDEKDADKTQIVLTRVNVAIPKISIPKIEIH